MARSIDVSETGRPSGDDVLRFPQLLSGLLADAVRQRATDIHVDTWGDRGTVRYRVDGAALVVDELELDDARRLINQIKVAADLDIDAARRPLEGQFRWEQEGKVRDVRVTIIPEAPRNEAAHMRLLTRPEDGRHAEQLGMRPEQLETARRVMQWPHGLVLIAGPTGSGKTTTLYALAEMEDLRHLVAASIEDPIEFDLPYVRQLEVDEKRGITMQEGLRALLRMDADLLMIGEIRDSASAVVAAQAALAGRLVLATIHARDAASAISAMRHLGVPPYVLASSLRMVIAQNLIRKLCDKCAQERAVTVAERSLFESAHLDSPDTIRVEKSCGECGRTGFKGRTGAFQVAVIDESHSAWLADGPPEHEVRARLIKEGGRSLHGEVLRRVADGTISPNEAVRVAGTGGTEAAERS